VLDQATAASLVPAGLDRDQVMRYAQITQANLQAARSYRPGAYPGRVLLFQASERSADDISDPHLGWEEVALGGVEVEGTPGGHFTMLKAPQVEVLARKLRTRLVAPEAG
jgi:thioesterase domain-containing protein